MLSDVKQVLTFDFETFYDRQYSLSRMSTLDYIMDKRFQPICLSVKVNNSNPHVIPGDGSHAPKQLRELLMDSGWEKSLVIAHNIRFDAAIARFRLKLPSPALYGCTRYMARAIVRPFVPSVTLANCMEYYNVGVKGTQRETYLGYRLSDFSVTELQDYMDYCSDDTQGCADIFARMLPEMDHYEMENIDIVLRMYLEPMLMLNANVLSDHLADVRRQKKELFSTLPGGIIKEDLSSNVKFQKVLEDLGIAVPMKISPKTGKEAPAFAKSDEGFKELLESEDPIVQLVCAARIGAKSTQEEARTERMLDIAEKYKVLCVPLVYAGAHTLRYAGDEKINMQNPKRGSMIRKAIEAPSGYMLTCFDYAQIEARILAALANCTHLLEAFRDPSRDPYAELAAVFFGIRNLTKKTHPKERWIGKTCRLGLGFQMGPDKLRRTLAHGEGGKNGVKVTLQEARRFVHLYRSTDYQIPEYWNTMDQALHVMLEKDKHMDLPGGCEIVLGMLKFPNGFFMPYHNLQINRDGEFIYQFGREHRKIYPGKAVENQVQALAAMLIRQRMVELRRRSPKLLTTKLQVHDDLTLVHPIEARNEVVALGTEILTRVPDWLPNLPLEIEVASGPNYLEVH